MAEIAGGIGAQGEVDGAKIKSPQCLALIYTARGLQVDLNAKAEPRLQRRSQAVG